MNELIAGIYVVAALVGTFLYNYAGFVKFGKPKGESYNAMKFLDTLATGGLSSVLLSVISYAVGGFQVISLFQAFAAGLLFSAGLDKLRS